MLKNNLKIICLIIVLISFYFTANADSITFYNRAAARESYHTWRPLGDLEGSISSLYTLLTMVDNFEIIDKVQKGDLKNPKLKSILDRFDATIIEKGRTKDSFIELYEYLNEQIPDGRLTNGSLSILDVLESGGDCNDVSPLFYSLFKYYGFDIFVIIGASYDLRDKKEELHAWIGITHPNEKYVELDPLWYAPYYEVKRSDYTFKIFNIKDKYILKRNLK